MVRVVWRACHDGRGHRAAKGGGQSGGFRTIILFKAGERAFFVRGFAKNALDNIRDDELAALNYWR